MKTPFSTPILQPRDIIYLTSQYVECEYVSVEIKITEPVDGSL
jgi:hypothetical protein